MAYLGSGSSGWTINLNFNYFSLDDFGFLTDANANALSKGLNIIEKLNAIFHCKFITTLCNKKPHLYII